MAASKPIQPEGMKKALPATEDDVEGHMKKATGFEDKPVQPEGMKKALPATEDDVEGHMKKIP